MPYYKAVNNNAGSLESVYTSIAALKTVYTAGAFVAPAVGKAFLFSSQAAAESFINPSPGTLEVWECEAEGVEVAQIVLAQTEVNSYSAYPSASQKVIDFWAQDIFAKGSRAITAPTNTIRPPEGTLIADRVKLIRKVA